MADLRRLHLPKGLYARAALILFVPVIVVQVLVAVVFVQRHFEGVAKLLTNVTAGEIRYFLEKVDAARTPEELARALADPGRRLGLDPRPIPEAELLQGDIRPWYDITGVTIAEVLRERVPEVTGIDFAQDENFVTVDLRTRHGPLRLTVYRDALSASNPHQLLVIMLLLTALMMAVAYIFLRNQLRPIRRLARAAEAFGKGLSIPYRPAGAREVRAAGEAFLAMRERIERQIESRMMMLSGISHDLRTPLTRIRLALDMIEPAPEIDDIRADLDEMERMISEFLAFARGDQGESPEPVDLGALLADIAESARRSGHAVALECGDPAPVLRGRPMALRRAVENLVSNAARHGRRMRIRLRREGAEAVIEVEDDGPGIPPELREAALRPFNRLDPARSQAAGAGVGLGLAIARDIARAHGGRLELDASADLGGLCARIRLPL
ncbi:MAG: HAMP domain-containing protein [Alphaproteobacteria bacterium]|nr:MAG: HAMP domain-containing protein [Alphaproteobacteria bacterium]